MNRTFIIAEAGVNHNGSLDIARKLIDVAKEAGADAVKFQTFKADQLVSQNAPKAEYQKQTTNAAESQWEMIKKLELSENDHQVLIDYCIEKQIEFLSTPFDIESLNILANKFNINLIKVPSGEVTNAPLLLKVAQTQKPVIMSTGMCTLGDIEDALGVLAFGFLKINETPSIKGFKKAWFSDSGKKILKEKVSLLHCTTEYPAPDDSVNLNAMDTMRLAFDLPVGFSDHSKGIAISIAAVAKGACIIEKHFTLDRSMKGPDHEASLEPNELSDMIMGIRSVELALGSTLKSPSEVELKNIPIARKSLIAVKTIKVGDPFTAESFTCKRPGTGRPPILFWDYIGKNSERSYQKDDIIL